MKTRILIIGVLVPMMAFGQAVDSLRMPVNVEFLYQRLMNEAEALFEEGDEETLTEDLEELLLEYEQLRDMPLNVNSDEIDRLGTLGILNDFQIEAVKSYRKSFGDLLFIEELLMLDEFNEPVVAVIAPLVYFGKNEHAMELERPGLGKILTSGRHQLTANYAEKFGGIAHEDYLGSPRKIQLKYSFNYKQKLRFGVVTEKDAGEPLFFDFVGAHFYMSDIRLNRNDRDNGSRRCLTIKELALGDYLLNFGQGLTLWSGMSFGKTSGGSSPMRRASGVKPKASSGEGKFFRGAATTLKYRGFNATAFYSIRDIDATVTQVDSLDEPELVSALQESGYHRTANELAKRNAIQQQVFGGHLCYSGPQLEVGFTAYHLRLDKTLQPKPSKYNQFYFQGDRLTDIGLDFRWLIDKTAFIGEMSRSDNGAFAGIVGMTVKPKGYVDFSVLYRNYDKRYQNLLNGAFGESSRSQGEEGFYLGLQCAPAPGWDLLAYADYFRHTWLTSQVYNPSWGHEYSLKVSHQLSRNASMQFRFKSKTKMKNSNDDHVFSHYPIFYSRRTLNFRIDYGITESLTFSDKVSYSHYLNDDGGDSKGYYFCHDIAYKPSEKPYSLTFRYALFDSDDYNSRVSVYENDVLGAFSIPSFSGLGSRIYLLGKVKFFGCLSIYSRVGITISEENTTDLKIEVIWKL